MHIKIDRRAAGIYFVADRIELAVAVGVRVLDPRQIGLGLSARSRLLESGRELVDYFFDCQDARRRAANIEGLDELFGLRQRLGDRRMRPPGPRSARRP
jgi:hypothetical protein